MSAFFAKFFLSRVARYRVFSSFCVVSLALAATFFPVKANGQVVSAREDLQGLFGTPQDFVTIFEDSIKEKSDSVIGLLTAASGFAYVIKVFL